MSAGPLPRHEPVRVLLLLSSLHGGGAERVAVHLLNGLDPARFEVRLGLLRAAGPYLAAVNRERLVVAPDGERRFAFDGSNRSQFRPATLWRGAFAAPRAVRAMIADARPHVVLSFLKGTNLIAWRALARIRVRPKWIAREGNNALAVIGDEAPFPLAARGIAAVTARAYRRADTVLTIAEALRRDLTRAFALDPARVAAIPNPVDIAAVRAAAAQRPRDLPRRPFVLATGRLEWQKGHDLLLRAVAASGAAERHDLVILGAGSREAALKRLAHDLGIARAVHWPGFQANPFAWMAACDLFVLPSRWEGFGSVLAEAMAAGAPVLAADCRYGPGEIVSHGEDGWLVAPDDAATLSAALSRLLADQALRARITSAAAQSVERFALEPILARYAALIEDVIKQDPS
jgi:glycosyltransferase involved in cell wall biosynthesis